MPTDTYVPRSAWGILWRLAVALGAGFLTFGLVLSDIPVEPTARQGLFVLLDLFLGVVAIVLMPFSRHAPLTIALILAALSGFSGFALGAVCIVLVSLATRRRWQEIAAVGIVWLASTLAFEALHPTLDLPWWGAVLVVLSVLVYGLLVAIGVSIGNRRDLLVSLRERAETAEREQAARLDQARTTERTRIAREMHDVLAHRISLVAMHSGALAYRTDLTREETSAAAAVIQDNAHLAMTELREVLGVLRETDVPAGVPERPQPTLDALPDLLDEVRGLGGGDADVGCEIAPATAERLPDLPEQTSRSAYRILQESLTNARKHAPAAPVRVEISGEPGEGLVLRVTNPLVTLCTVRVPDDGAASRTSGAPPSGLGLTGLAERARLTGGELRAAPDGAGSFVVRAWLPWT
ncbi:sensor histidine kinase [Oerskovia enterophila]|uniref:histidine kinase n=1 Tax=Oerskovia enterophila TaxID=43678 RepID=A0ABX2Y2M6_9CELL|nr:histidine kinase [Oerskovia enterophila]OCI30706.1 sensor histidine kinase LiaS [Oerskovia enterophila]